MTRPRPARTWPEARKLAIVTAMAASTSSSAPSASPASSRAPSGSPASSRAPSCAVCGSSDARTLSSTALASGAVVLVCGSHAVAHSRAERVARTVRELRAMLGERRSPRDRRDGQPGEADELAQCLSVAFSTRERRKPDGAGRRSADA